MIKHTHTEPVEINFSKLEERILNINNSVYGKYNDVREMLYELINNSNPTLIMATGGSKAVAYYLELLLETISNGKIICEVIEPRDYIYKTNIESFSNLIVISSSGNSNGIKNALDTFKGNKYLICEEEKEANYKVIAWGNELYEKEKSFISLASTLGPITLFLDYTSSFNNKISSNTIKEINYKIKKLYEKSQNKIEDLQVDFKDISLIQIFSGYETKSSCCLLESNLTEVGLLPTVIHDKGSFCHGRSNLLFQYPNSYVIYLSHSQKELDNIIINTVQEEYSNISVFNTNDINENIFWKEYYLILQMYFLSKKIANDKNIDLTMPEYNPKLVKKLYNFKGEM